MSTMTILQSLETFLKEKVVPTIKLQKANDNDIEEYTLVNPSVHIGWLPPKGYLPEGMEAAIPCLVVGLDDATKDSEADFSIRISAAVYSPGLHKPNEVDDTKLDYYPDFKGYHDLLNLIDRTVFHLERNVIIDRKATLEGPIKWGMYPDQQPYPYWYGWITFSLRKNAAQSAGLYNNFL